jgi:hypothetical protein
MKERLRLAMIFSVLASCGLGQTEYATDAELLANFRRHRAAFEEFAGIATEDSQASRVSLDSSDSSLSTERYLRYRSLFRDTGVHEGLYRPAMAGHLLPCFPR